MTLSSKVFELTASDQELVVAAIGTEGSAHGIVFQNNSAVAVDVTMKVHKSSLAQTTTLGPFSVSAKGTFAWPKPVNLEAGDKIIASAATTGVISALLSYYSTSDIDTAVSVGFTPRGNYVAGATYAVNDVAYYTDADPTKSGSYLSRVAGNIGNTPSTSPAQWMIFVQRGLPAPATAAELRTRTDNDKYVTSKIFSDMFSLTALSVSGNVTLDIAAGPNFVLNLTGNITLLPPSNMKDGDSGVIYFVQDVTGGRTVSLNVAIKKFGVTPTLSTPAYAVDRAGYMVRGTTMELTSLEKSLN